MMPYVAGQTSRHYRTLRLGELTITLVVSLSRRSRNEVGDENDPLGRALERGSKALDFVNAPLVLDYTSLKFSSTLPNWLSRAPFDSYLSEGCYMFSDNRETHVDELSKPWSFTNLLR